MAAASSANSIAGSLAPCSMAAPCWSPAPRPGIGAHDRARCSRQRGVDRLRRRARPADGEALGPTSRRSSSTSRTPTTSPPLRELDRSTARQQRRHRGDRPARVPAARRAAPPARGQRRSASSPSPRPACPALRRTHGRIVNVSSISGRVALPLYGPYAASKFALEALSDSLRRELRGAVARVADRAGRDRDADLGARARRRRRALRRDAAASPTSATARSSRRCAAMAEKQPDEGDAARGRRAASSPRAHAPTARARAT